MKGVSNILENDATLIALLDNGANSVFSLYVEQGEKTPHVVIDEIGIEPNSTMTGTSTLDFVQTRVFCVSDRLYTGNSIAGAREVADAVRGALDNASGTYGTEVIAEIDFESESVFSEGSPNQTRQVIEQIYEVSKRRS